jgi:hypothetical protein
MMECLIIGDSIANGVSHGMPDCVVKAEIGIDARTFIVKHLKSAFVQDGEYHKVIISLGSNNHDNQKILTDLRLIRSKIHGEKVYWILPSEKQPQSRTDVLVVAGENMDYVIDLPVKLLGPDQIHPRVAGYDYLRDVLSK